MLKTENLSHTYDNQRWIEFPDMECPEGSNHLILGQSGMGKTTLLHILGGILKPKKGTISINGTELQKLGDRKLDKFRGDNIGVIFQQAHFLQSLTVQDNLLLAQKLAGKALDKQLIANLLDRLNVASKLKNKTSDLSVGEKQRVAIARALVNKPTIILADEPSSALDDVNCDEVIGLLKETAQSVNATLLIVTHDQRLKDQFKNQIHLN